MQIRSRTRGLVILAAAAAGCFSADDLDRYVPGRPGATHSAPPADSAVVFLFRGAGEVFSPGFNEVAATLSTAGRPTRVLASGAVADDALPSAGPLVLGGHSAGAFNAIRHARRAGRPVDLLVLVDPPMGGPIPVSANVRRVLLARGWAADVAVENPETRVDYLEVGAGLPVLGALWNHTFGHVAITSNRQVQSAIVEAVRAATMPAGAES